MKIFAFLLMLAPISVGHTATAADLTVNVEQVDEDGGSIVYALYGNEAAFTNENPQTLANQFTAEPGTDTITLHNIAPGFYAFTAFHDVNENLILDKNFLGLPKEQFGISNITRTLWSSPSWDEVKFEVTDGEVTTINLLMKMQ